jgi:tight adherence protein B
MNAPDAAIFDVLPWIASGLFFLAILLGLGPLLEAWDRFARWWISDLLPGLESLEIDHRRLGQWLRWWGVAVAAVPAILGVGLHMWILSAPAAAIVILAPRMWLKRQIDVRRSQIRVQLVPAMVGLANTTRAGLPLAAGMESVAAELAEPLRSEFRWIVANVRGGLPLAKALESTKQRLQIEPFTLFSATLQTTLDRGGRVTEMLERLSSSVREMERLQRTLENATASGRRVILILAIFPAIFLGAFLLLYPEGTLLMFQSVLGEVLLLVTIGLVAVSVVWSNRILSFGE